MTTFIPSPTRTKVQQPRFLIPFQPMQRMPDMLTDEEEGGEVNWTGEHTSPTWEKERLKLLACISRLMTSLGWTETHYGPLEIDNARPVLVTEDEHGNVKVAKDS